MQTQNERPVCHRAEDLVTYLYGEASAADAQDFAAHMRQCDACRAEYAVFNQVHESIVLWRNEALGAATAPQAVIAPVAYDKQPARKLPAIAALREFFAVSPLWLRGATAFATLLLFVFGIVAVSRLMQKPVEVVKTTGQEKVYTPQQFDAAVKQRVDEEVAKLADKNNSVRTATGKKETSKNSKSQTQLASNRSQLKVPGVKGLTRKERLQLAADLRLIPGRDEGELPFVLTEEPER